MVRRYVNAIDFRHMPQLGFRRPAGPGHANDFAIDLREKRKIAIAFVG